MMTFTIRARTRWKLIRSRTRWLFRPRHSYHIHVMRMRVRVWRVFVELQTEPDSSRNSFFSTFRTFFSLSLPPLSLFSFIFFSFLILFHLFLLLLSFRMDYYYYYCQFIRRNDALVWMLLPAIVISFFSFLLLFLYFFVLYIFVLPERNTKPNEIETIEVTIYLLQLWAVRCWPLTHTHIHPSGWCRSSRQQILCEVKWIKYLSFLRTRCTITLDRVLTFPQFSPFIFSVLAVLPFYFFQFVLSFVVVIFLVAFIVSCVGRQLLLVARNLRNVKEKWKWAPQLLSGNSV